MDKFKAKVKKVKNCRKNSITIVGKQLEMKREERGREGKIIENEINN